MIELELDNEDSVDSSRHLNGKFIISESCQQGLLQTLQMANVQRSVELYQTN